MLNSPSNNQGVALPPENNLVLENRQGRFVYEERLYRKCAACNDCVKAIVFTQVMVCSISSVFYLVVFGISINKQNQLPIHLVTILLQFLSIFLYILTLYKLKRRFPRPENATCKNITQLYIFTLSMVATIGALILAKMLIDVIVNQNIDSKSQEQNVNYDWLLLYLDFLFSMIGLQVIAIVELGLIILSALAVGAFFALHGLVWLLSGKRVSMVANFLSWVERKQQAFKTQAIRILSKFKTRISSDPGQQEGCPICCQNFKEGEQIYKLECIPEKPNHVFHTTCLNIWSRSSEACPSCRTKFSQIGKRRTEAVQIQ